MINKADAKRVLKILVLSLLLGFSFVAIAAQAEKEEEISPFL